MGKIWKVRVGKKVLKDIDSINKNDLPLIKKTIHDLSSNPFPEGVKKLKGKKEFLLRIRVRKYRIIYQVKLNERLVIILAVAYRKDVYK